jgi:enoyl-CoA hydratase/carnithine racemase
MTDNPARAPEGRATGPVTLDRRPDGVAVVTIDHAASRMNTLAGHVVEALHEVARELTTTPSGAVVLTGRPTLFSAGAEVSEFTAADAGALGERVRAAYDAFEAIPRVTIAAISGYCLGAGLELVQTCDFRFADPSASFAQPEILLGLLPGGGGTQRLPRLIGLPKARELILSGRRIDAAEAHAIGLVDTVVPDGEGSVLDAALAAAARYAAGATLAHGIVKATLREGLDVPLAAGLTREQQAWSEVFATEDAAVGIRSFFENGVGKAVFPGR